MANPENLIPQAHKLTVDEQSKGGRNSGRTRRKKKTFRELIQVFGATYVSKPDIVEEMTAMGIEPEDLTNDMAVVIGQYTAAVKGKTDAATWIRDTKGEKPHDVLETPDIVYKPLVDLTKRKKNGEDDGIK